MTIFGLNERYADAEDDEELYFGVDIIDDVDARTIERLNGGCLGIRVAEVTEDWEPYENSFAILNCGEDSALVKIQSGRVVPVSPSVAYGIQAKNVEQVMALDALLDFDIPLVTLTGVAGTGKTLLAMAAAIEIRKLYKVIRLSRPVMPMGKDVGYLPGDLKEKMANYMAPFFDNLAIIKEQFDDKSRPGRVIGEMIETEKLMMEPITYIRGRSLSRCFLIVDEAQNLTSHEIKTIITRAGEGTKIILTGDIEQIDNPKLNASDNGLAYTIRKMKGQALYAHVHLTESERSPLAKLAGELL